MESLVPYIVTIKDKYVDKFKGTTIRKAFCGYLVNRNSGNFYFELNGNRMLVIVNHNWIEVMAPSKVYFELIQNSFYREEEKTCDID